MSVQTPSRCRPSLAAWNLGHLTAAARRWWPSGSGIGRRPAAIVSIAVLPLAGCAAPDSGRPNVVLVSIDTLRADQLSVYGYHRSTSPNLEALAKDGVVFEDFVNSGGGTLPSHLTMLTSLYPAAHGVTPHNGRTLAPENTTLAEILRQAGYSTAAFVDSGWMKGRFGFVQGFDLYDDQGGRFEAILPKTLEWLRRNRDRRFLLFVHTYDVHSQTERLPYECPGDYSSLYAGAFDVEFDGCRDRGCASRLLSLWNQDIKAGELQARDALSEEEIEYVRALYDGCINYADEQVGRLIRELKELGLYDEALLIVTSDHGEEFVEHGRFLHDQSYEEIAHIPLIMKLPLSQAAGRRVPRLAAMVDLMPTVLEIAGSPVEGRVQGRSLLPAIMEDKTIRQATHMYRVARTPSWKYYQEKRELYDLAADPAEAVNVVDRRPELVEQLGRYLEAQLLQDKELRRDTTASAQSVDLSPEEVRQLEALGYLN